MTMAPDALSSVLERLGRGPVSAGQLIRDLEGKVESQDVRTAINDGFASGQIYLAPDGLLQSARNEP
ncbi:MAG: hypothetical protein KF884_01310 [Fimbriimonadaceae bacterium]|nr:hypothetical protein [Fimbriimonadaceae bacterium]QYK58735.1 MAG: hypothetical protein KF884_01310 [Fimbriimonadaceae bacterium]